MIFKYHEDKTVEIDMKSYVQNMLEEFPIKFGEKDVAATPATDNLFIAGNTRKLDKFRSETFRKIVAKGLFICKRGRPDIQPTIAALCTRVVDPIESDWYKLIRLMRYLNGTKDLT